MPKRGNHDAAIRYQELGYGACSSLRPWVGLGELPLDWRRQFGPSLSEVDQKAIDALRRDLT